MTSLRDLLYHVLCNPPPHTSYYGTPIPCTTGPSVPTTHVANEPSMEDAGKEYSDDGVRDLSGSATQKPEVIAPQTSQAKAIASEPKEPNYKLMSRL